jgi:hypothetical protein
MLCVSYTHCLLGKPVPIDNSDIAAQALMPSQDDLVPLVTEYLSELIPPSSLQVRKEKPFYRFEGACRPSAAVKGGLA